jgi:hypothetical protein
MSTVNVGNSTANPVPVNVSAALPAGSNTIGNINIQASGTAVALGQTTMASSLPVAIASNQSNVPTNITQVGGASVALGQTTMASSFPVTIASNQSNVPANIAQVGGASVALGQTTMAASLPVTIASNQSAVSVTLASNNSTMIGVTSPGGTSAVAIAAAATNTVIKSGAGRLCRVVITTAGTTPLTFYDNATGGSTTGTILGFIPANAAAGSVYDFQIIAATGIQAPGGAGTPAVTVGYI